MTANSFTTTSSQGFFSRVGGALVGAILGPILILAAAVLIFYNESHASRVANSLREGAASVVEASPAQVDAGLDGKLVHLTGETKTDDPLRDPDFGVEYTGVKLARTVAVYEWKETSHSRSTTNAAGTKTTTTTYDYEKSWNDHLIDSASFKQHDGHTNPASLAYPAKTFQAESVTLGGGYQLDPELVEKIGGAQPLPLTAESVKLPERTQLQADGVIYVGASPDAPDVGDLRITEQTTPNGTVSVVAAQQGAHLTGFPTKLGEPIALLSPGTQSAPEMFQAAQSANVVLLWVLRAVGFVVLFIGIHLVFGPISILASIVPFLGALVGDGVFLISLLLAVIGWVLLVGAAWLTARPMLAIPLFAVAILALAAVTWLWIKRHAAHMVRLQAAAPGGLQGNVAPASS